MCIAVVVHTCAPGNAYSETLHLNVVSSTARRLLVFTLQLRVMMLAHLGVDEEQNSFSELYVENIERCQVGALSSMAAEGHF